NISLTTTVMMTLVFFLLCSGKGSSPALVLHFILCRLFVHIRWETALNRCKKEGGSLVTLYDDEDATFTENYVNKKDLYSTHWLGLIKNRTNITTWSNGDPFTCNRSSVNPANIRNGDQICEAMENKTWKGFNCSDKHPFMCYKDPALTQASQ
uniref:C-type lectin domain-containing protein n=1 Tax=Stegastes partitus TaxID=144197 RepID=A0A3B5ATV7_9TELE